MKSPVDAPEQLVSTLITLPPPDRRLIDRVRLAPRLADAVTGRLTCVRAPAGFGKTSLVAGWAAGQRDRGGQVAWLSLNPGHDDPRVLLRYLVAALRAALGAVGEATLTLLNSNLPMSDSAFVTTLVNELGGLTADAWLVLDDFHCLDSAATNAVFHELVVHAPSRLHFVLTSRAVPGFPTGRLRERGEYTEILATELEFSDDEVQAFLARETLSLSDADSIALSRNTGGWAAGLRLAVIAMRDEPERSRFIRSLSGGYAAIAQFLQEDVLARQPAALQRFLVRTSVLDEMSASQCDFVLERNDSGALLSDARDRGLFVFSLDHLGERFRYHHLFADFLRARLERDDAALARRLNLRASAWHEARDEPYEAVEYALRGGDEAAAGALLENNSEALFASGQLERLGNFAQRVPASVIDHCPRFQLDLVWIHTLKWEIAEAERRMTSVRRYVDELSSRDELPEPLREKVLHREIMIALLQDNLDEAERLWEHWPLIATGADPYLDGSAETARLLISRERFDVRFVIAQAPRVRRKFLDAGTEYGTVWFDSIAGPAYLAGGDSRKAAAVLGDAMDVAARVSGPDSPLIAMPALLLAEVLYERNELKEAGDLVERWLGYADRIGFVDQLIAGFCCAARLAFANDDPERAAATLARGEELASEYAFARLAMHLAGERVRQLDLLGRVAEGAALIDSHYAMTGTTLAPPAKFATVSDEIAVTARARVSVGQANQRTAVRSLKAWVNHVEGHGCTRAAIRLRAVLAGLLQSAGETRDAWRTLRPAIQLAADSGIVRPLLDERERTGRILAGVLADERSPRDALRDACEWLRDLLDNGPAATTAGRAAPAPPPGAGSAAMTPREREILDQIADGSSNKEVANRLGLSEATVKWHLQHVYQKLGVHRRIGAVRRARELGIIR